MDKPFTLYAARGGGSAIVEAQLVLCGVDYTAEYFSWEALPNKALFAVNPLGEIPALRLQSGEILTETAAVTLWLGDQYPESGLVPLATDARRAQFLRRLIWLVAALYPTFTYGDHPERFVDSEAACRQLRTATDRRRSQLWKQLEQEIPHSAEWLCGGQMTAVDIFLAVMSCWRPRREWLARECPTLYRIARQLDGHPLLGPVWLANELVEYQ